MAFFILILKEEDLMIKEQSNFSRSLSNEVKMGAYFTDKRICKVISSYIDFGESNLNILEPTIGDGTAVLSFSEGKENVSIFGAELEESRYKEAKDLVGSGLYRVILSDFLKARITNSKMDMVFANPPYLNVLEERFESVCLQRCTRYLAPKGMIIYIVGRSMLENEDFIKYLVANYENLNILRFPTAEEYKDEYGCSYQFFNQICIFGYKRERRLYMNEEQFENELEIVKFAFLGDIDLFRLTTQESSMYKVRTSNKKECIEFKGNIIDVDELLESMGNWSLHQKMEQEFDLGDTSINSYTPPIDPKNEHKFFIALSSTSAVIGEEGEKHLLRTFVSTQKTQTSEIREDGDRVDVKVVTNSKVIANVLNADGSIVSIM